MLHFQVAVMHHCISLCLHTLQYVYISVLRGLNTDCRTGELYVKGPDSTLKVHTVQYSICTVIFVVS
jgi:hypothetical protein